MKKYFSFCLLIILITKSIFAQKSNNNKDSLATQPPTFKITNQIAPLTLLTAGFYIQLSGNKKQIQEKFSRTDNHYEDYYQYMPIGLMYLADVVNIPHKNNAFDQTKNLILSQLSTAIVVQILKRGINARRPNGGNYSFPSGHTSQAFTGASVLFQEFKNTDVMVASSGYVFAAATGYARVTNNKHWTSDVLVGAGIGIIMTNLVYYFGPLKNWNPLKINKNISFFSMYEPTDNSFSAQLNLNF